MRRLIVGIVMILSGCNEAANASARVEGVSAAPSAEEINPPFPVRGELEGLMLTYLDEGALHTVSSRAQIPEHARARVRVDSPTVPPEARDPETIFVADVRTPRPDGTYVVRRVPRDAFQEAPVATPAEPREGNGNSAEPVAPNTADVVLFGASWCGACQQAKQYFTRNHIAFVEHDIEREPGARADMQRRAAAAGVRPRGIPVIDVRGRIFEGFDPAAIERALRETAPAKRSNDPVRI